MAQFLNTKDNSTVEHPCDSIAGHPIIYFLRYSEGSLTNDFCEYFRQLSCGVYPLDDEYPTFDGCNKLTIYNFNAVGLVSIFR